MWPVLGGLISGGASLLGGLFGQQNQNAINQQNIAAQEAINTQNIQNQDMLNAENTAEQEKFAQMGVQWKVDDARAAGINPLAALGAQTASFANNVGATAQAPTAQASNSFGTGVANAGQDISRAMQAMQSPEQQAVAAQKTALDLESLSLDNDIKRASLASSAAKIQQTQQPGLRVTVHPPMTKGTDSVNPSLEQDAHPDMSYSLTSNGGYAPQMSKDAQDRGYGFIDDAVWNWRNRVLPSFQMNTNPPSWSPGEHKKWVYNPFRQDYESYPADAGIFSTPAY